METPKISSSPILVLPHLETTGEDDDNVGRDCHGTGCRLTKFPSGIPMAQDGPSLQRETEGERLSAGSSSWDSKLIHHIYRIHSQSSVTK